MRTDRLIIPLLLILTAPFISCSGQSSGAVAGSNENNSDKIEAYYFHFTARCVTCLNIESKAKENLEALYPNLVNNGLLTWQSVNLEDASTKPLAKRLGISGQTLLIVKGDQKINLTNEGFMYAMAKPDRFKEIINEKVDGLLMK
ncbi:MAG: nitrophenyl compound nitroreductase subunit ArsF family protein [Bacteroidales bacterium]